MKRWLGGLLAALTLFSLTACGLFAPYGAVTEDSLPEKVVDLPTVEEDAEPPAGAETPSQKEPSPNDFYTGMADLDTPEAVEPGEAASPNNQSAGADALPENGTYTAREDVALYIHQYGRLPDNFITKKEAQNLGWPGGDLEPYAPGMCIGGSRFGNYEGLLPEAEGRTYTECDIDTLGARSRGAKRIVFSNDGLIYYTEDHYESFELLYGDEGDG